MGRYALARSGLKHDAAGATPPPLRIRERERHRKAETALSRLGEPRLARRVAPGPPERRVRPIIMKVLLRPVRAGVIFTWFAENRQRLERRASGPKAKPRPSFPYRPRPVLSGKRQRSRAMKDDGSPETQEPARPLTKAERYEQAIEAGWQDWLESTARNNPKYVPEVEAEIAALRQQRQRDIAQAEARARGEQADSPPPTAP